MSLCLSQAGRRRGFLGVFSRFLSTVFSPFLDLFLRLAGTVICPLFTFVNNLSNCQFVWWGAVITPSFALSSPKFLLSRLRVFFGPSSGLLRVSFGSGSQNTEQKAKKRRIRHERDALGAFSDRTAGMVVLRIDLLGQPEVELTGFDVATSIFPVLKSCFFNLFWLCWYSMSLPVTLRKDTSPKRLSAGSVILKTNCKE